VRYPGSTGRAPNPRGAPARSYPRPSPATCRNCRMILSNDRGACVDGLGGASAF
jgi:hypothetical protein